MNIIIGRHTKLDWGGKNPETVDPLGFEEPWERGGVNLIKKSQLF